LQAQRGKILDRNGAILAISSPVESIWINPRDFKPNQQQLQALSGLLAIAPEKITEKAKDHKREFVFLKRRLSPEIAGQVMQLQIAGMFAKREYRRYYPAAEISAHLVGFTGLEENGQEGMELRYDAMLAGKTGSRRVILDRHGHILDDLGDAKAPHDGQDVVMSIDRQIQYLAYRETLTAVEEHHAKAGAAIVLDARTGEVLAMVNLPTYNPNNPVNISGKSRNRAIVDVFEPGSTMKPVAIAAGLESGKYRPDSLVQTAPGQYSIGPATIHDTHN
jgi:cell division protein FtsI (penicillin-binding protein 3)